MLNRVGGFMVEVGKIVRHHHERWDGGGYPDGLAAEESALESRIIVCCVAASEETVMPVADHEPVIVPVEAQHRAGANAAGDAKRAPQRALA